MFNLNIQIGLLILLKREINLLKLISSFKKQFYATLIIWMIVCIMIGNKLVDRKRKYQEIAVSLFNSKNINKDHFYKIIFIII